MSLGASANPKLLQLLAVIQQLSKQGQGGPGGIQKTPGQIGPQVGPTPPFIAPGTSSGGGGGQGPGPGPVVGPPAQSMGTLPMPQARPASPGFQPQPNSAQMMNSLDPKGKETFSAIQGVSQLLQAWNQRKDQKEEAEAANIAQNLMTAMRNNDTATVHEILNDKHATKVLNKVYKGWLTKSQEASKPQEPAKPPDPAVKGFEQGLVKAAQGGASAQPQGPTPQQGTSPQGPQAPPQGGQPQPSKTQGGYLLPQAGPAQQLQGIKTGAELDAAKADPARTLDSQLTSGESRQAELGKSGLASTPATDAKLQESMAKLQEANLGVQKAQLELQSKQAELQATGERTNAAAKKAEVDLTKAQVQLDITRTNLLIARERSTNPTKGKTQQPPLNTVQKLKSLEDAQTYIEGVIKSRGKNGFTGQDVQTLTGLLKQAGASSLAQSLPGWYGRNMPTWIGGKGEEDANGMLESIKELKSGIEESVEARYPGWQTGGKKGSAKAGEEPPDEGEEDDSDIVVSPEEVAQ
jgi:hypothetical protein